MNCPTLLHKYILRIKKVSTSKIVYGVVRTKASGNNAVHLHDDSATKMYHVVLICAKSIYKLVASGATIKERWRFKSIAILDQ